MRVHEIHTYNVLHATSVLLHVFRQRALDNVHQQQSSTPNKTKHTFGPLATDQGLRRTEGQVEARGCRDGR